MGKTDIRNRNIFGMILPFLLAVYALFSPIELFLGGRVELMFRLLQYFLVVVLFCAGPIPHGRIHLTNARVSPVLPYVMLLLYMSLSLFWTNNFSTGTDYLLSTGMRILMIIFAFQLSLSERALRMIFIALMIGTVILAVMLMGSSMRSAMAGRTTLSYNDAAFDTNNLSGYLVIGFALILNFRFRYKTLEVVRLVCAGICIVAILMTGSRGGTVAMLGTIVASGLIRKNIKSTFVYLLAIFLGGGLLVFLMQKAGVTYIENVITRFTTDSTGSGRVTVWAQSIELARARPVVGYGIGGAFTALQQVYYSEVGTHNVYLTFLLDGGVIGLLIFLSCLIVSLFSKRSYYSAVAKMMIVASMIASMFLDTYNKKILWLPLLFFALTFSVRIPEKTERGESDV